MKCRIAPLIINFVAMVGSVDVMHFFTQGHRRCRYTVKAHTHIWDKILQIVVGRAVHVYGS